MGVCRLLRLRLRGRREDRHRRERRLGGGVVGIIRMGMVDVGIMDMVGEEVGEAEGDTRIGEGAVVAVVVEYLRVNGDGAKHHQRENLDTVAGEEEAAVDVDEGAGGGSLVEYLVQIRFDIGTTPPISKPRETTIFAQRAQAQKLASQLSSHEVERWVLTELRQYRDMWFDSVTHLGLILSFAVVTNSELGRLLPKVLRAEG